MVTILFQFHKGTIRTNALTSSSKCNSYFNSIKVQLELCDPKGYPYQVPWFQFHKGTIRTGVLAFYVRSGSNFNSIKVQLERKYGICDSKRTKFQFHKGTIRTQRQTETEDPSRNFNSIKVQLEPAAPSALVPANWNFNSIKVQLERGVGCAVRFYIGISIP